MTWRHSSSSSSKAARFLSWCPVIQHSSDALVRGHIRHWVWEDVSWWWMVVAMHGWMWTCIFFVGEKEKWSTSCPVFRFSDYNEHYCDRSSCDDLGQTCTRFSGVYRTVWCAHTALHEYRLLIAVPGNCFVEWYYCTAAVVYCYFRRLDARVNSAMLILPYSSNSARCYQVCPNRSLVLSGRVLIVSLCWFADYYCGNCETDHKHSLKQHQSLLLSLL